MARRRRRWWQGHGPRRRRRPAWRTGAGPLALLVVAAVLGSALLGDRGRYRGLPIPVILDAIREVESSGGSDRRDGDDGRAIGPYQIHRAYWEDAVAEDPSIGGDYQDCRRRDYAERVIEAYMRRYVPEAWTHGDAEIIARTHNGGPDGARQRSTLGYWQRVKRAIDAARMEQA